MYIYILRLWFMLSCYIAVTAQSDLDEEQDYHPR